MRTFCWMVRTNCLLYSSLKIALLSGKKSSRNFGWDAHGYDAPSALRRAAELFEGLLAEARDHEISCHWVIDVSLVSDTVSVFQRQTVSTVSGSTSSKSGCQPTMLGETVGFKTGDVSRAWICWIHSNQTPEWIIENWLVHTCAEANAAKLQHLAKLLLFKNPDIARTWCCLSRALLLTSVKNDAYVASRRKQIQSLKAHWRHGEGRWAVRQAWKDC